MFNLKLINIIIIYYSLGALQVSACLLAGWHIYIYIDIHIIKFLIIF